MTSFKFPPPPPPPRAASNDNQPSYTSQRGGHRGGRGDGGCGRGGGPNRGGNNSGGYPRGGHGQSHGGRGNHHPRGGPRGGQQNNRGGQSHRGASTFGYGQQQQQSMQAGGNAQPQLPLNALAQAVSFMSTPAGIQSMAAFASHMACLTPNAQSPPPQQAQPQPRYSPPQHSGQKRKREDGGHGGTTQSQPQLQRKQQGPKPPRAKAAVAPAIPSFGFSLPKPPPVKPARAVNTRDNTRGRVKLGLTHGASSGESSSGEDEDEDEEAVLGAALKGGGYAFEHEGEYISLQTAGDVKEWIKDRRRNFPTREKAEEKAKAKAERRKNELEFMRKLKGKPPREEAAPMQERPPKAYEPSARDQKKQEELAALRKRLQDSMHMKQAAPKGIDLGVGYGSETESDDGSSSVLSESSVVSSSEESSDDSDEESDDDDVPPEPVSSKMAPPPINVPPPPTWTASHRQKDWERPCPTFERYGKCSFGNNCKFKHSKKEEGKRTTLYEKLVEQELVKSDHLALDAIKFLGQNGFLG